MNKRILIAGGAGFLGLHLCKKLLSQGHKVICVDTLHNRTRGDITHLLANPLFELVQHDICFPLHYVEVDEIYNLACPAAPAYFQRDPVQTIKVNVYGSMNLLELAKSVNAKILQASTIKVQDGLETTNPCACYSDGKRCAEVLFFSYHHQYKTRIKVARLLNNYGPGMHLDGGEIIPKFITQALSGEDLVVYNNGSASRIFCYVGDLIDGLTKLMDAPDDFIIPVNIGGMVETTFLELAEMIIKLTGTKSKIISKPMAVDAVAQNKQNMCLTNDYLGWEPVTDLESGLTKTIEYIKGEAR